MENKERPILFSTDMVVSILEGRKTMTRRIISIQPDDECYFEMKLIEGVLEIDYNQGDENPKVKCPYGQPGDILWVREAWTPGLFSDDDVPDLINYRASSSCPDRIKWKPSIHMKKLHARIWLQITDIRVERLNEITEQDAIMEGISATRQFKEFSLYKDYHHPQDRGQDFTQAWISFSTLWETINGRGSWVHNPWVWVISFKVLSTTGRPSTITSGVESKPCIAGRLKSSPSGKVQEQVTDAHLLPGNGEGKEVTHA